MKFARLLATVVAAVPLAALSAPPAAADVVAGGGGVTASECSGLHCWAGVLTANMEPLGSSGTVLVTWNCQAAGSIDPLLTSVTTCAVGSVGGPSVTLPGPYAASAGAAIFVAGSTVNACVAGQSVFAEDILGDQQVGDENCDPLQIVRLPL